MEGICTVKIGERERERESAFSDPTKTTCHCSGAYFQLGCVYIKIFKSTTLTIMFTSIPSCNLVKMNHRRMCVDEDDECWI